MARTRWFQALLVAAALTLAASDGVATPKSCAPLQTANQVVGQLCITHTSTGLRLNGSLGAADGHSSGGYHTGSPKLHNSKPAVPLMMSFVICGSARACKLWSRSNYCCSCPSPTGLYTTQIDKENGSWRFASSSGVLGAAGSTTAFPGLFGPSCDSTKEHPGDVLPDLVVSGDMHRTKLQHSTN